MGRVRAKRHGNPPRRRVTKQRQSAVLQIIANLGVFCLTLMIGLAGFMVYYARDLPDTKTLWRANEARQVTLLASDGSPITMQSSGAGAPVRLADIPGYVSDAVLAVEDRNFYHHVGFNLVSIGRAFVVNAKEGSVRQGGSTITQQLAKNVFLNSDRTLKRKVQELLLAIWLEQRFTKDEILTLYLNRVYFGAGAYGVDAASYRYFGKPAHALNIGEAAVLAGLLKAPSRLSPTSNPQSAGRRARLVLDKMVETGALSPAEAAYWIARPVRLHAANFEAAPYFVDYVMRDIERLAGDIDADLVVRTTFDSKMQAAAVMGMMIGLLRDPKRLQDAQAAVVLLDQMGAVRAMIGGRDYRVSQFNRAAQARRQPGSAFKPVVYLAAVKSGLRAHDIVLDAPLTIGGWSPDNYKHKYYGEVTLREALARSLNGAAIRVQEAAGRKNVRETARALGLPGQLNDGAALALGVDLFSPLELAGAYAAFANGGLQVTPYAVQSIETLDGDVIYRAPGSIIERAALPAEIAEINDMLVAATQWGSGRAARLAHYPAFGKTGTSQKSRDAWFAGHAGDLTGVVWVGRDDNAPMPGVTGGGAPAIIWREVMTRALESNPQFVTPLITGGTPAAEFPEPAG